MKSIFYRFPLLYNIGMHFLYFDGLKILKDIIGRSKSVFEPACGFGRIKSYLYPDCNYSGIDLNETFINYGQKKKRDISVGNVFDENKYRTADTILLCDILHHLKLSDMHRLISLAIHYAREKVVIIEPLFVDIASKGNFFSGFIGKVMSTLDSDGYNTIDHWMSKEEYKNLFQSFQQINHVKEMKNRRFRKHVFIEMVL